MSKHPRNGIEGGLSACYHGGGIGIGWVHSRIANLGSRVRFPPMPPHHNLYTLYLALELRVRLWMSGQDLAWQIFGGDRGEALRGELKSAACNKSYAPPVRPDHLARDAITHYRRDRDHWKRQAIAARQELSRLKRASS